MTAVKNSQKCYFKLVNYVMLESIQKSNFIRVKSQQRHISGINLQQLLINPQNKQSKCFITSYP